MKKCDFYKTEIDFLSFIVNKSGLRMDPSRVEAISEWRNYPPKMTSKSSLDLLSSHSKLIEAEIWA